MHGHQWDKPKVATRSSHPLEAAIDMIIYNNERNGPFTHMKKP